MYKKLFKDIREKYDLTQEDLAKILNISVTSVSLYESGSRTPRTKVLRKFCEHFDIPFKELLEGMNIEPDTPLGKNLPKKLTLKDTLNNEIWSLLTQEDTSNADREFVLRFLNLSSHDRNIFLETLKLLGK